MHGCACQGLQFDHIGAALNDTRFSATAKVSVRFVWNHTTAPGVLSGNEFPTISNGADARLASFAADDGSVSAAQARGLRQGWGCSLCR